MNKRAILLVEDDGVLRDLIKDALAMKYEVIAASDYSEAIKHIDKHIDLAVIDYVLPDYDGLKLLKEIRQVNPELPVIITTGYSHETVAIMAVKARATDYLKKPFSTTSLMKTIAHLLCEENGGVENEYERITSREDAIMDGIVLHMKINYMKELTLETLAEMAGMSKSKFCRSFKKRFGHGFKSYLNHIRVGNASELLKNPDLSITEIALFVGYGCIDQFERIFKQWHGVSPRKYRREIK